MSNSTLVSRAFKPAVPALSLSLLREILAATPLSIFAAALKPVSTKPLQR
jgi:hypothetical protein